MPYAELETSRESPRGMAARRRTAWVISPLADLALLIVTPLAIVPLILYVAWRHFSVEQISLVVVAFASVGHQLPGFLRAYSDAELFARYRWRMLLAPPLILVTAWLITRTQLHGLILLLLLWSTWHVLMQTYGMLRIYDLKQGRGTERRARLDFWACVALFAWGFTGSESRLFVLAEMTWRIGLPLLTPTGTDILFWTIAGGAMLMLGCYLVQIIQDYRAGQLVWVKPVLLLSTGWLYWLCGTPAIPILLGIAMFEIFHAIQYDTLVWAYDRNLGAKLGRRAGPLRAFLERRGSFTLIYLAAIGIFGALRFLPDLIAEPQTQAWLLAAITASTLLHFYFDGFIWKVSAAQRPQSAELGNEQRNWGVPHLLKCTTLGLVVGGALLLESHHAPQLADEASWLANAAAWAPHLPEVQLRLCRAQVAAGDIPAATDSARRAVALLPNSAVAFADLGAVLLRAEQYSEAAAVLNEASRLAPAHWQYQFDLGLAQTQLANWSGAEQAFISADRDSPRNIQIQCGWADMELARGDASAAAERLHTLLLARASEDVADDKSAAELSRRWIVALSASGRHEQAIETARRETTANGESPAAWFSLGQALNAASRFEQAIQPLTKSLELHSADAAARYQLGLSQLQVGNLAEAQRHFQLVLDDDPRHALAWFQQANIAYLSGDLATAAVDFRQSIALKPKWADARSNLGAVLFAQRDWPAAETAYHAALELAPNNAGAHYNLGLLLIMQNDLPGARRHIARAAELGQPASPEIAEQLGLNK